MYSSSRSEFLLSFSRAVYCPCCSISLGNLDATVVDGWLVCTMCAFSGAYRDPMFVRARERACVAEHILWSRNVRAYAPRKNFQVPLPLIELVTALETSQDPATIALGDN